MVKFVGEEQVSKGIINLINESIKNFYGKFKYVPNKVAFVPLYDFRYLGKSIGFSGGFEIASCDAIRLSPTISDALNTGTLRGQSIEYPEVYTQVRFNLEMFRDLRQLRKMMTKYYKTAVPLNYHYIPYHELTHGLMYTMTEKEYNKKNLPTKLYQETRAQLRRHSTMHVSEFFADCVATKMCGGRLRGGVKKYYERIMEEINANRGC